MMKQAALVAIGGAAIVAAGLVGCSSGDKAPSSSSAGGAPSSAASGKGTAKVTIDGQSKDVQGTVGCATMGGNVNIAIGEGMTALGAVVSEGDSPTVTSVALGNVGGVSLLVGGGQGEATATKDGKTYKITGTAFGMDMANPMQPAKKPFEIEVTCP